MPTEEHLQYVPEPSAVNARIVIGVGIASLILLTLSIGGFYLIYDAAVPNKTMPPFRQFAAPRVVTHADEVAELKQLKTEQTQRLQTWRWANDQHTLVQIPIDRAVQLLAKKGADAYAPLVPPSALSPPTAAAQQTRTERQP
jgi:hypothetical protein